MTNLPNNSLRNNSFSGNSQPGLEGAIARALENPAIVLGPAVPEQFVARVMAALPPQRRRRPPMPVGRTVAVAGALVLALTMFALAPESTPDLRSFAFDMELLLLAQLAGIAYWFTRCEV